jgi:1-deoxy-D-xylulose-5-phosphate reductoisomerase
MGAKITVDSATLMNKGIECLEAMRLFDLPADRVGALIHPSSQAHAAVAFRDGTFKLLVSAPDMRLPAAAALAWPERLPLGEFLPPLEPERWNLSFEAPDPLRYPCFRLALEAARTDGRAPALLVAADEVAVAAFLAGKIRFTGIAALVEEVLCRDSGSAPRSLEDVLGLLDEGRRSAERILGAREGRS